MKLRSITVFCGSSYGTERSYEQQARQLGAQLAAKNIGLVYGGADVGLMGAVADSVLKNKGRVTGVLPHFLSGKEIAHKGLTTLILVDTMHQRKTKMEELCDGVIALPGGFGTIEELFEMLTWGQLGLHQKPVGILNINGFYDGLLSFVRTMVDKGFLKQLNSDMLLVSEEIDDLLLKMEHYMPPQIGKWIKKDEV